MPKRIRAPCTSLSLHWNNDFGDDGKEHLTMANCASLLRPLHHLRALYLRIESLLTLVETGLPVVLEQLEYLSLSVTIVYPRLIGDLLDNFKAPNVRKLKIKEDESYNDHYRLFIQEVLFPEDDIRWPCLEIIDAQFSNTIFPPDDEALTLGKLHPLHYMLTRLPNISSLSITYDNDPCIFSKNSKKGIDIPSVKLALHPLLSPVVENETSTHPYLYDLTLRNCRIGTEFFTDNLSLFTSPTFESLNLEETCDLMDIDAIRGMLPPDKVMMRDGEIVSLQIGVS